MDNQLLQLLAGTLSSDTATIKRAEAALKSLYAAPGFPLGLATIAANDLLAVGTRQASLSVLEQFIKEGWSSELDDFQGVVLVSNDVKQQLRDDLLRLALNCMQSKVKNAASNVVSKIGRADFPEDWPELLTTVLQSIQTGEEHKITGALTLLIDLMYESFNEEQFFGIGNDLMNNLYVVATSNVRQPSTKGLAIAVFRGCLDTLQNLYETYKPQVKAFAGEIMPHWLPFLLQILQSPLPALSATAGQEANHSHDTNNVGQLMGLKAQAVKTLLKVRSVFPSILAPYSSSLFTAVWNELKISADAYVVSFVMNNQAGHLPDRYSSTSDLNNCTLDLLVLQELDLLQSCFKAGPVRKELELQNANAHGAVSTWLAELFPILTAYAQIPTEQEEMWKLDVNLYLSEEANPLTNLTTRAARGDLVRVLVEWLQILPLNALLQQFQSSYGPSFPWRSNEAMLYVLSQVLEELTEINVTPPLQVCNAFIPYIQYAIGQPDELLYARAFMAAGLMSRSAGVIVDEGLFNATLQALSAGGSEIAEVASLRAIQSYLEQPAMPGMKQVQNVVFEKLSTYLAQQDLQLQRYEPDDYLTNLAQTFCDVILLNPAICVHSDGLRPLFAIAQHGAHSCIVTTIIAETFADVARQMAAQGHEMYNQLCAKAVPPIIGAIDVSRLTSQDGEESLLSFATSLLELLTDNSLKPLPPGLVAAVMPHLNRILLQSEAEEVLSEASNALRNMLSHDPAQVFAYRDSEGKDGFDIILVIIDRLLGNNVSESASKEVGRLALELVTQAGPDRLNRYIVSLLTAVAVRLASAQKIELIQSLILVFAGFSVAHTSETVDFLAGTAIGGGNGLQVVMSKWLENSESFSRQAEIQKNVLALSKLYDLHDPRLAQIQVKGDLIVTEDDGRIVTRSRAKIRPDRYTMVPANLKILKILIEEYHSAKGSSLEADLHAAEDLTGVESGDDDEWEDDNMAEFGLGTHIEELMALGDETPYALRERDEETHTHLVNFFRAIAQRPDFQSLFDALTPAEQQKLQAA